LIAYFTSNEAMFVVLSDMFLCNFTVFLLVRWGVSWKF